jgi:methyl acetate hydrolase
MSRADIDAALDAAVADGTVPGVVAMAATPGQVVYEGAFGERHLGAGPAMTLDTVFRIASMTKAITSVAAMQLVEQGKLSLDGPLPDIDPALSAPQVLSGFDAAGRPQLRAARRPITLKHLLTHTAGFSYEFCNETILRYNAATAASSVTTGAVAALRRPLIFDPCDRWLYGCNIEWVGRIIEELSGHDLDTCFRERICAPLGLADTCFVPSAAQYARQAASHQRLADGSFAADPATAPAIPEYYSGGGGLVSTAADYLIFLRMLLNGGALDGARILRPETVALMGENHIGDIPAGVWKTTDPTLSHDLDLFPGQKVRWGLAYLLSLEPGPHGRSAGSVAWAGIRNTHFWLDPVRRVAGVFMTQTLPFLDPRVMALYAAFERGIYGILAA